MPECVCVCVNMRMSVCDKMILHQTFLSVFRFKPKRMKNKIITKRWYALCLTVNWKWRRKKSTSTDRKNNVRTKIFKLVTSFRLHTMLWYYAVQLEKVSRVHLSSEISIMQKKRDQHIAFSACKYKIDF